MIGKISLVLNILLIAAVAYLFTQLRSDTSGNKSEIDAAKLEVADSVNAEDILHLNDSISLVRHPVIAFIYGDSIATQYQYQIDKTDEIIKTQSKSEGRIRRKAQALEKEMMDAEKFAQSGNMTESDYAALQQSLGQGQMALEQLQVTESEKLAKLQIEAQNKLLKKITDFLDKYSDENGIDIVLNYQGGSILHANGSDVTMEVLKLMNEEYAQELTSTEKQD